jgi:hypothetical protein
MRDAYPVNVDPTGTENSQCRDTKADTAPQMANPAQIGFRMPINRHPCAEAPVSAPERAQMRGERPHAQNAFVNPFRAKHLHEGAKARLNGNYLLNCDWLAPWLSKAPVGSEFAHSIGVSLFSLSALAKGLKNQVRSLGLGNQKSTSAPNLKVCPSGYDILLRGPLPPARAIILEP